LYKSKQPFLCAGESADVLQEWVVAEARFTPEELVEFRFNWNRRYIEKVLACTFKPTVEQRSWCACWAVCRAVFMVCTIQPLPGLEAEHHVCMQIKQTAGVGGLHVMPFGTAGRNLALRLVKAGVI
jgi:hypothetical protein